MQCIPLCTAVDLDEEGSVDLCDAGPESMDTLDSLSGWVPRHVIWKERKDLRVKFLSIIPAEWTYGGREINTGNIMSWANEWSLRSGGVIPEFIDVQDYGAPSDIRVQFTSESN